MWPLERSPSSPVIRLRSAAESSTFTARQLQEEVVSPTTAPYTGHRALTIAGFLIIAVGAMHLGITLLAYKPLFRLTALWFAGSGVAIVLIGILTLFARSTPPGSIERWAAAGANVAGLVIAVAYSALNGWREPRGYVEIVLFIVGGLAALLAGRGASRAIAREPARAG
jgi:MFS family permease